MLSISTGKQQLQQKNIASDKSTHIILMFVQ